MVVRVDYPFPCGGKRVVRDMEVAYILPTSRYPVVGDEMKEWTRTDRTSDGSPIYQEPDTQELAVERDGQFLVYLSPRETDRIRREMAKMPIVSIDRAKAIAAECPLRWRQVVQVLSEHIGMSYHDGWFSWGPVVEVAEFAWSCWIEDTDERQD